MIELEYVGPALRFLRRRRGVLQYELARRAGVTKAMLSGYERGARLPSLRSLAALLNAQGFDFGTLHRAMEHVRQAARQAHGRHEPPRGGRS